MKRIIFLGLILSLLYASMSQAKESNSLIVLSAKNQSETEQALKLIESLDGEVRHVFVPDVLIGYLPEGIEDKLIGRSFIVEINHSQKLTLPYSEKMEPSKSGILAWNRLLKAKEKIIDRAALPEPSPLVGDIQLFKDAPPLTTPFCETQTSDYMIGRVSVGIVLMESNGSAENWTTVQEQNTLSEILQGLDRLSSMANDEGANLTWFYEVHYKVPTSYEPIQEQTVPYNTGFPLYNWVFLWMNDALSYLGIEGEWDGLYQYVNNIRRQFQTDWGFVVFVVMDENDPNHMFNEEGTWFAYSRVDGPYIVMTYNNDNWTPEDMNEVLQHEVCHVFGANDEYAAGCDADDCSEPYGYLHVPNANCASCNQTPAQCIMRSNRWQVELCVWTKGQVGWRDSDGDGPNDPIDPNSGLHVDFHPVNPGDRIDIYTLDDNFVKSIAVTPDNCAGGPTYRTFWDGINGWGVRCLPQQFLATINRGDLFEIGLQYADPNIRPVFSDFQFINNTLKWKLSNSYAYVRCQIYDNANQLALSPIKDKLYDYFIPPLEYQTEVRDLTEGATYTAKFFGWRADGATSEVTNYSFVYTFTPLSPNGGEIWEAGSTHPITWAPVHFQGDVKISYTTDGGSTWSVITPNTSNTGTYNWTLPNSGYNLTQCRVKIEDAQDGSPSDMSNNFFTITPGPVYAPSISVQRDCYGYIPGILVSWQDNNVNELGYRIERRDSASAWQEVATTGINGTNFRNRDLRGSEVYFYQVRAYNQARYSAYSNEVSVKFPPNLPSNYTAYVYTGNGLMDAGFSGMIQTSDDGPPPKPGRPTNAVILHWGAPLNQKIPIRYYRIIEEWYINGWQCDYTTPIYGYGDTLCPLMKDFSYYFYVYAVDSKGDSCRDCRARSSLLHTGTRDVCPGSITKLLPSIPKEFSISQNSPNPFNPQTEIKFSLPEPAFVCLKIFNILGQVVQTLVNQRMEAGSYSVTWDGKDDNANKVSSGVYFYRIQAGKFSQAMKMILTK